MNGALNIEVQNVCTGESVNHTQLPTDPAVEGIVVAELAAGPTVTLGSGDCARLKSH
jgi:triacylglycerol lipase